MKINRENHLEGLATEMAPTTAAAPKRNDIPVLETPPPPPTETKRSTKSNAGSADIDDNDDDYMPAVFSWLSVEVPVFLFAFREDSRSEIENFSSFKNSDPMTQ